MNRVEVVTFPRPGVRAAAARKEAVEELAGKIQGQSRTAKEERGTTE